MFAPGQVLKTECFRSALEWGPFLEWFRYKGARCISPSGQWIPPGKICHSCVADLQLALADSFPVCILFVFAVLTFFAGPSCGLFQKMPQSLCFFLWTARTRCMHWGTHQDLNRRLSVDPLVALSHEFHGFFGHGLTSLVGCQNCKSSPESSGRLWICRAVLNLLVV